MTNRHRVMSGDSLDKETVFGDTPWDRQRVKLATALTVAWHPDPRRVGGRCVVPPACAEEPLAISRATPLFLDPAGTLADPLGDRRISRSPLLVSVDENDVVTLDASGTPMRVDVDGAPLEGTMTLGPDRIEAGVVIELAGRVTLVLHHCERNHPRAPSAGLVGESDAILRVRSEIQGVAEHTDPVLLVGESGTGKYLVARAIHAYSDRSSGPFVHRQLPPPAGVPDAVALFGTDGDGGRGGWFHEADGGTLVIEQVDEGSSDAQLMLQQVIETGRLHRVGASRSEAVDVRLIVAATHHGNLLDRLRAGLLFRLARYELQLPPLRERREDIGRLLLHFLREELSGDGGADRLAPVGSREHPWLSAPVVSRLVRYDWPGNVLQIQNVAAQLALMARDADFVQQARVEPLLVDGDAVRDDEPTDEPRPLPREISKDELLRVLKRVDWVYARAARELGIARGSIYKVLRRHGLRLPGDIGRVELAATLSACRRDVDRAAERLQVSPAGLRRRLQELDLLP